MAARRGGRVLHAVSLGLVLFGAWLLMSGHFEPLLLGLGIVSCVVVVLISRRMDVVDREGHPVHLTSAGVSYWPWLAWEIVKANYDVAKRSLQPSMPISPTVVRVKASQRSDVGQVIYANSITLTPGTISVDVGGGEILVHALTREGATSLEEGEMDRRCSRMVGDA
jgi:multicomponent Na+:H+ antiporter subunit E